MANEKKTNGSATRVRDLFNQARDLPDGPQREQFLKQACGDNARLRQEVESLLKAHKAAEGFLNRDGAGAPFDPFGEAPGTLVGRYRILEHIGEGGFGEVYRVEQTEPVKREVALKIIKLGMDTKEVIARFEAERQALALMDHPNIARVFDAGATDTGRPYFVMELACGPPITDYCDSQRLSLTERLKLFQQVCTAVQHAHQKGIIHRDLKPSNIVVTLKDDQPVPKIIDFGIAKSLQGRLTDRTLVTQRELLLGTPAYMSPEQVEVSSEDLDTRTDIYSLGVLLYELIAGVTPFETETLRKAAFAEVQRIIREVDPPKPSTRLHTLGAKTTEIAQRRNIEPLVLERTLRGDLDWIVMKAIEKDRQRRYDSAAELGNEVQRHLSHEAVKAGPPSKRYLIRKWIQRNRAIAFATASVVLALCIGLGLAVAGFHKASRERDHARSAEVEAEAQRDVARRNLYYAHIHLAQRDWEAGQVKRVLMWLEDVRPAPGEPDLRGWEWYYLLSLCHRAQLILRGHTGAVRSVSWSPDGQRVASAGDDQTIRIWDVRTGQEVGTLERHAEPVLCVAWSPDGRMIASSSHDETLRIWDSETQICRLTIDAPGLSPPQGTIAWSPDGSRLALMLEQAVMIWDADNGREISRIEKPPHDLVSMAWSPDGGHLALGQRTLTNSLLCIWSIARSREVHSTQLAPINSLGWSADGRWLAAGTDFHYVALLETMGWQITWVRNIHQGDVLCVAWNSEGALASAGEDGTIKILEPVTGDVQIALRGHTDAVNALAWSPSGQRLASASRDGTVRLWDAGSQQRAITLREGFGDRAAWHVDGRVLAVGGAGYVEFWNVSSWTQQQSIYLGSTSYLTSLAWSSDGCYLAGAYGDGWVRAWDVNRGQEVFRHRETTDRPANTVAWRPNAPHLATAGYDRVIRIWDLATTNAVRVLEGHRSPIRSVAWDPTGRELASVSWSEVKVWDIKQGNERSNLSRDLTEASGADGLYCIAWGPQGDRLAIGNAKGEIVICSLNTRSEVVRLKGHFAATHCVSWSPDGQRLASGGYDGTVRIWDAQDGQEYLTLPEHLLWRVLSVSWSPDGQKLVATSGEVKVWDARVGYELGESIQGGP